MVSVIVNTYNYGRYIVEAIESVLAQSLVPDEVIIVDDGSTDNTPAVLREHYADNPRVRLLSQRNGGQLAAIVRGLENANGDIIFFLDADDKYDSSHIEGVTRIFDEHNDIGFVFTAHRLFGDKEGVVTYAPEDLSLGYSLIATYLDGEYVGSVTSSLAIRRNVGLTLLPTLRQVAPRWTIRADDCVVYGASLGGFKKYYLSNPTVLYRVHGQNRFCDRKETNDDMYLHGLRRDTFVHLLSQHLGLGSSVRLSTTMEFFSIERPTRAIYRRYVKYNCLLTPFGIQRVKGHIRLYQHYSRNRPTWDKGR